ncbi:MAG: PadR family transcriptional regulator [Gemmatimonadales bacterium]
MGKGDNLGEFEQLVLLAILRLEGEPNGMSIRREIERTARRAVAIGSVYAALERLEGKGLVGSTYRPPDPETGGKPRRHFRVERAGRAALTRSRNALLRMWEGVSLARGDR